MNNITALPRLVRLAGTGVLVLAVAIGLTEAMPAAPAHAEEVCQTGPTGVVMCTDEPDPDPGPVLEPPEPGEVCFLEGGDVRCADDPEVLDPATLAPPDLISPFELAKLPQEQREALLRYQDRAITNALRNHGLPDSERRAMLTWGRTEAQAELLALVAEAIEAPEGRVRDQVLVNDWLTSRVHAQLKAPSEVAVLEFVKWAGLEESRYYELLRTGASEAQVREFLAQEPRPYNRPWDRAGSTSGYCKYHPPAGFEGDYTGRTHQTCYYPCAFWCSPPMPTYDQFAAWGVARTEDASMQTADYVMNAAGIARAAAFSMAMAAAIPVGVAAASALAAAGLSVMTVWTSWFYLVGTGMAFAPVVAPAGAAAASAVAMAAASFARVAGTAATVLTAIIIAILVTMQLVDQAATPVKLASALFGARARIDLRELLDDPARSPLVYANFVDATIPSPRFDVCDNSRIPADVYEKPTYDPVTAVPRRTPPYGLEIVSTTPCLNAVPPPAPTPEDPMFVVRPAAGSSTGRLSDDITLATVADGTTTGLDRTVRLHGSWFVQTFRSESDAGTVPELQMLKLTYTDWNGREKWARLVDGTRFLVVDAQEAHADLDLRTCQAEGWCQVATKIQYVDANGEKMSAAILP